MKFKIDYSLKEVRQIFLAFLGLDLCLTIAFCVTHIFAPNIPLGPVRSLFDLDSDYSIPCWYSSIKLFLVGCSILIASLNNSYRRYIPSRWLFFWGFVFIFLSMDEVAMIHERLSRIAGKLELDWLLIEGHGAWIILYGVLAFLLFVLFFRYIKRIWKYFPNETIKILAGCLTLVSGGVVVEVISYFFLRSDLTSTSYKISVMIEESLEMAGVSIILCSMMLLSLSISSIDALDNFRSHFPTNQMVNANPMEEIRSNERRKDLPID